MNDTIYLGDAVYAHFDGCGIELRLNDHRNERAVLSRTGGAPGFDRVLQTMFTA
jgi:hypothetical protein